YDPATGSWTKTGSLSTGRVDHTATLLPGGKVLVAGGFGPSDPSGDRLASAELYDPASGTWTATAPLNTARLDHTATLLPHGRVLVAGGNGPSDRLTASAELFSLQVNDDPGAGINPALNVSGQDPTNADVVGGALTAGEPGVPWAIFRQATTGKDQVFV